MGAFQHPSAIVRLRPWPDMQPRGGRRRTTRKPLAQNGQLPRILKRIYFAAGMLVAVTVLGTLGFMLIDDSGSSFSDALYMTLITITTVGYGEAVPLHTISARIYAGLIAFIGFGGVTFLFTSLSVFFLESDFDFTLRRGRMNKKIDHLNKHFIVCGYGRVGQNVGTELFATKRTFVALDPDLQLLLSQADRNDALVWQHGDATDDDQLITAGIDRAQGIFAVSNDDAKNMMIALTAKQLNPNVRVVARCHDVRSEEKLRKAGADQVVLPDFTGGLRIVSMMVRPQAQSFIEAIMRSDDNIRMEEITLPADFEPCALGQLKLRSPEVILMAVRGEGTWQFNPQDDFELRPGQVLVAMATPQGLVTCEKALGA